MKTAKAYCRENRITCESTMVGENPNNPDWKDAYHYKVVLKHGKRRKQLTTYYSMGYAHCNEPQADDVIGCLVSDACTTLYSNGFENWASDLGYDPDSRKAEKIYKVIEKQSKKLENFLGEIPQLEW